MPEAIIVSSHEPLSSRDELPEYHLPGEHRLQLPGPAGDLEVRLSVPVLPARGIAIVCHPHSLMGGTMDNKVVTTLARVCRDAGLIAIRFNFRGVGGSGGRFDQGAGEQADVLALARWADAEFGLPWCVLAGFSFGAYVAEHVMVTLAGGDAVIKASTRPSLWLVAPPVTRFTLAANTLPIGTRVIYGDADEVVDPQAIADWLVAAAGRVQVTVVPGASHFFHGQLGLLKTWAQNACKEI